MDDEKVFFIVAFHMLLLAVTFLKRLTLPHVSISIFLSLKKTKFIVNSFF